MSVLTSTTIVDFINTTFHNNQTTTTTSTTSLWIQILTIICMSLIDICAFLGNLLVICAFFRTRRLQTVTNYFIASLAFADALVAIFVLPLSIYYYQRDRSWKLGLILCDLWVSSDVLLCTSSILNLTCISLDRYMAITRPLTYTAYRSKFLARIMILLVWILSAVITCPPIFGWRDPNRRYTVEFEHQCELNTARGYVVYSALGSFYIPAVIMIFVYIRIFMVVYDRENLIKKFQDSNQNNNMMNSSSSQMQLKINQNGISNTKHQFDSVHDNLNKKTQSKMIFSCCFCCCLQRRSRNKSSKQLTHQTSTSPPFQLNHDLNFERKTNGYLVYRFTNPNSAPNTPPSIVKPTNLCRPCTISANRMRNLSDEISEYRRNCISYIGAEYQFRTGDSPCFESKVLAHTLSSSNAYRSHSLEQSPAMSKQNSNADLISRSRDKQQQNDILLLDKDNDHVSNEHSNLLNQSLHDFTKNLNNKQIRTDDKYSLRNISQRSTALSAQSSSSTDQVLTNTSVSSNLPEQTRINRRVKQSRTAKSTPSAILIENIKQQHKVARKTIQNNNSSLKSNYSIASIRRLQDNVSKKSPCSACCCCCCLKSSTNWDDDKMKQVSDDTPNLSLTNDDDENRSSLDNYNRTSTHPRTFSHSSQSISMKAYPQSTTGTLLSTSANEANRRERLRFIKEQKTAKALAVVVGGFILFWLPFFIMYIIPSETYVFNAQTITLITWLGYFNSVINPFIYAYCSKQFRMAFWNLTFGTCFKKSNSSLLMSPKNKDLHRRRVNT